MVIPQQIKDKSEFQREAFCDRFAAGDNALRASILEQRAQYEAQLCSSAKPFLTLSPRPFLMLPIIGLVLTKITQQLRF